MTPPSPYSSIRRRREEAMLANRLAFDAMLGELRRVHGLLEDHEAGDPAHTECPTCRVIADAEKARL